MYNVRPSLVTRIMKGEKANDYSIKHIEAKSRAKKERRDKIRACVEDHLSHERHIWTA